MLKNLHKTLTADEESTSSNDCANGLWTGLPITSLMGSGMVFARNVAKKNTIRDRAKACQGFLAVSRSMMFWVVPVSPSRGNTFAMLYSCASELMSVMASMARVTLKPSS